MRFGIASTSTVRRPASLIVTCWTMLLVILLSAAPTGAAPRTQLVGSAFDPSTVSVVVKPSQQRKTAATQPSDDRKRAEPIPAHDLHDAVAHPVRAPAPLPAPVARYPDAIWQAARASTVLTDNGPRAPPSS